MRVPASDSGMSFADGKINGFHNHGKRYGFWLSDMHNLSHCFTEASMQTAISKIMSVEGQITEMEAMRLFHLAKQVPNGATIVEIGSYRGRSTVSLALGAIAGNGNHVYAIDPHEVYTGIYGAYFGKEDQARLYRNLSDFGVGHIVSVICFPSNAAAKSWSDRSIGLLWIDGDHAYESVRADYEAWKPFLTDNAIVAFHDTDAPGVQQLTSDLVASGEISPKGIINSLSWYERADVRPKIKNCIILGSGRSGTSMGAGVLSKSGYFMGDNLYAADEGNPKGYFEDKEVNEINDTLIGLITPSAIPLEKGIASWAPPPMQRWLAQVLPGTVFPDTSHLQGRIRKLTQHQPFCFKDPRFCYTLPVWRPFLQDVVFLCIFRHPAETVTSMIKECARAPELQNLHMSSEVAFRIWELMYRNILESHYPNGEKWLFAHYNQFVNGSVFEQLEAALGTRVDAEFVDPRLKRSKTCMHLPVHIKSIYHKLCNLAQYFEPQRKISPEKRVTGTKGRENACFSSSDHSMVAASIVIPTFNRVRSLVATLNSLVSQDFPRKQYEILIVDNGSTDSTRAFVKQFMKTHSSHRIRYFFEPHPGLLAGRHCGAVNAEGEICIFTDDDIEASHGWLSAIHESLQDKTVHLVGGPSQPKFEVNPPQWLRKYLTSIEGNFQCGYLSLAYHGKEKKEIDPTLVWGLNFAIRRKTLFELGGFHPDCITRSVQFFQGDGETGLSLEAKNSGLKALYVPHAKVNHIIPKERLTIDYFEERFFYQGVCDSYTEIRKKGNLDGIKQPEYRKFAKRIGSSPEKNPSVSEAQLRTHNAYVDGYRYHQDAVKSSPCLLRWVLKKDYFDYRLPELEKSFKPPIRRRFVNEPFREGVVLIGNHGS